MDENLTLSPMSQPNNSKRILMLNYEYPPLGGGGGVATQFLVEALAHQGVPVTLVTSSPDRERHVEDTDNLRIIRLPVAGRRTKPVASLRSLFSYIRAVKAWALTVSGTDFFLIHSQFAVPTGIAGRRLAQRWSIPHIVTLHGFDIHDPTRRISADRFAPVHWVVQHVLDSANVITTQSEDIARRAREDYKLKTAVHIIPLGIPLMERPFPAARPASIPHGFLLVAVGRLVRRKGFDVAIQALSLTPKDTHLAIIGSGPELKRLKNLTWSHGVRERVHFLGPLFEEGKWHSLASADAYILPSLHEGFSLSTLEAMMMALPVIATNVGGQLDFLTDKHAILVPPANHQALAEAIQQLYADAQKRFTMARNNLEKAHSMTNDRMAEQYTELYAPYLH